MEQELKESISLFARATKYKTSEVACPVACALIDELMDTVEMSYRHAAQYQRVATNLLKKNG